MITPLGTSHARRRPVHELDAVLNADLVAPFQDWFDGHSWASGITPFAAGKNQVNAFGLIENLGKYDVLLYYTPSHRWSGSQAMSRGAQLLVAHTGCRRAAARQ